MNKIVAFGASNNSKSINRKLAEWASKRLKDTKVDLLDLNDYEFPIYSSDREQENGIPEKAYQFKDALRAADGIVISFAEHNGSYSAAFKNILDWVSRIERPLWLNKPMFLLATSPGQRGGQGVLTSAVKSFPHQGGQVVASYSLPSFNQNFIAEKGIYEPELKNKFEAQLANFEKAIHESVKEREVGAA